MTPQSVATSAVSSRPNTAGDPVRPPERFLVFGRPTLGDAEIAEVVASMKSGWIGTGPKVAQFEQAFAAYTGVAHAVAVSSGSAALHLALVAAGLGPGDEVITTPLTFCSTVNAILHVRATPVLVDVDPHTRNLDPVGVAGAITDRTRALLPVHYTGRPCDLDALGAIAARHRLLLVEDAAHALEARYRSRPIGSFGDLACFSTNAIKSITTGEGGIVLTRTAEAAALVKQLSTHGMTIDQWGRFGADGYRHYDIETLGFKYNMLDLEAAIGLHQLPHVEAWLTRREQIWRRYDEALADLPLETPPPPEPDTRHARHLYSVLVDEDRAGISRDEFLGRMKWNGIGVGVHCRSVPEHTYYQRQLGWKPEQWPVAMDIGRRTVSLPLMAHLTDDDVEDVIVAVQRTLRA